MQTVLITGANRGLGLGFCKQYAEAGWRVIATCRCPDEANGLHELALRYAHLQVYGLDVSDFSQIDALSRALSDSSIDVLINNAGIYTDISGKGFGQLDYQAWSSAFWVNSIAPVKLAEAFLPQIKRSSKKLIVAISSLMGSMTDNTSGGSLQYRSSKAGLNAAMKSLAIDLGSENIGVLVLHPGWVRTDMGGQNALIDVEESVTGMRRCIDAFSSAQSGSFLKFDASELPW
ncbi:SDR family oxidoreductase [Methylomonas methanica]|uniref:Short-chain dehydrogenase/reductase SDR n=1 Tax=Methylomonas methanica (strain DSM 25384 / MC09) TaxID=857087 RepID=G0A020_METMM|nr:SDR family oxidoreductase [Methylomonas methanica]AEG01159.1 short-chain dehydrogenase/reductase SDR [Methylomonas methanica MC09]